MEVEVIIAALICVASITLGAWLWWRFPIFSELALPTEWQHIGDQINSAMIFARTDFANVPVIFHDSLSTVRQISRANSASSRNTEKLALC